MEARKTEPRIYNTNSAETKRKQYRAVSYLLLAGSTLLPQRISTHL